jgi:5-methylcytosine-specific restriction endonuclease McrA
MTSVCSVCSNSRFTKTGKCIPCYTRQWRLANKDSVRSKAKQKRSTTEAQAKQRAYMAAWQKQNADAQAEKTLAYRRKNRAALRDYARQWRVLNNAKSRAAAAAYRAVHLEQTKATVRAWQARNKERMAAAHREWRAANPEARRIHTNNRRERIAVGRLSKDIVLKLYLTQAGLCACCEKPLGTTFHLDHRVPLKLGGTNTDDNVQLLTARCNLRKGRMPYDAYLSRMQKELEATSLQSADSQ